MLIVRSLLQNLVPSPLFGRPHRPACYTRSEPSLRVPPDFGSLTKKDKGSFSALEHSGLYSDGSVQERRVPFKTANIIEDAQKLWKQDLNTLLR